MELQSISVVSRRFNVSVRTLRYYEQMELISSEKKNESVYRYYNEYTMKRIQQIILLRKLRIPLKQIAEILQKENVPYVIEVFKQNLLEIEEEIAALSTIKSVIQSFMKQLNIENSKLQLLDDESLLEIVDSLTVSKINFKEDKTMEDLNKANQNIDKIKNRDVRIIYLPPAIIAASSYIHDEPDNTSRKMIDKFVCDNRLNEIKPDIRYFDYIRPNPQDDSEYGYEIWLTIPENAEIPEALEKRKFQGGLYAAYTIYAGEWNKWEQLIEWLESNTKYEWNGVENSSYMHGLIDEHINYIHHLNIPDEKVSDLQFDLLVPIKERELK